ncbi:hypothetical protein FVEN_g10299 [Fusarium venenatum]|uniref:Malic acid transport protein n=1 Tax=Fusarium venenatum TaxID=56646 RepID=A0A2L2SWN8_9HYPO|nr:uncharacterized protein FVRRES_06638 [Fusarium venenatum]KAG8351639.1 hypothetical protein FVEN_g10299 [Fusarium venenatum]KAH6993621.1 voltage-dependent anion channel-domain-containing protein [Fusarium venenatum]CEI62202.1 unnamed protein product [Fusarium venenatum]
MEHPSCRGATPADPSMDRDSYNLNNLISNRTSFLDPNDQDPTTDVESGTSTPSPSIRKQHDSHTICDIYDPNRPKLKLRQRLKHFTWASYTLPMSTGGLSLLLYAQPHQFTGLRTIGLVMYIINLIIFTSVSVAMASRFLLHQGTFVKSLTHPREGFFVPTCLLSMATLITSTDRYAIAKDNANLVWAVQASFWGYLIVALVLAIGQYSYVFAAHSFSLNTMMPTWLLPVFPIMLSGTIASVIAETQPNLDALTIIGAGLTCQGLGLSVAVMMYAHMIGRLMQAGLPNREHRPGLFMCVGPPAFTALAVIGMANGMPESWDIVGGDGAVTVAIVKLIAVMSAIFLWALSLWWFGIAAVAVIQAPPKYFHLGFYAMVFPNTGFTLATISIGKALESSAIGWVATGMTILILCVFVFVFVSHVKAFITQDIMYPGRDEDVEDH